MNIKLKKIIILFIIINFLLSFIWVVQKNNIDRPKMYHVKKNIILASDSDDDGNIYSIVCRKNKKTMAPDSFLSLEIGHIDNFYTGPLICKLYLVIIKNNGQKKVFKLYGPQQFDSINFKIINNNMYLTWSEIYDYFYLKYGRIDDHYKITNITLISKSIVTFHPLTINGINQTNKVVIASPICVYVISDNVMTKMNEFHANKLLIDLNKIYLLNQINNLTTHIILFQELDLDFNLLLERKIYFPYPLLSKNYELIIIGDDVYLYFFIHWRILYTERNPLPMTFHLLNIKEGQDDIFLLNNSIIEKRTGEFPSHTWNIHIVAKTYNNFLFVYYGFPTRYPVELLIFNLNKGFNNYEKMYYNYSIDNFFLNNSTLTIVGYENKYYLKGSVKKNIEVERLRFE